MAIVAAHPPWKHRRHKGICRRQYIQWLTRQMGIMAQYSVVTALKHQKRTDKIPRPDFSLSLPKTQKLQQMQSTQSITTSLRDKAWARWTALGLLAFAMFCSYVFMDILSPIKDLLQSTRGWDSTAFGTMQGSETFLNVFIFFLIFAGIILDKMGVRFTAVLSGAVMLVGASINWYALTDAFLGSSLDVWFTNHLNHIPVLNSSESHPSMRACPPRPSFRLSAS